MPSHRFTHVVYVTETCPGCVEVKRRLDANPAVASGVLVRYADRDEDAKRDLFATGKRSVPTLRMADGRVVSGGPAILRALGL